MNLRRYFYYGLAFLAVSMAVCRVQAATVVYEDFNFVAGETVFSTAFEVTVPGLYKADLVDFAFPAPLDILALGITQNGMPLGIGFGTGSFTFNVMTPGTLFAHLAAVPESGGEGLYGLQIMSVPVPAAIWLLLSGVFGIATIARRGLGGETI